MGYDWDPEKRLANIAKHDIDFNDVIDWFEELDYIDIDQVVDDELRTKRLVCIEGVNVSIIFTVRRGGDVTRIISAFVSSLADRKLWQGKMNS